MRKKREKGKDGESSPVPVCCGSKLKINAPKTIIAALKAWPGRCVKG